MRSTFEDQVAYQPHQLDLLLPFRLYPDSCAFFFRNSDGTERNADLDFVWKACLAIAEGYTVL